ncbi:MAG: hypothetical protein GY723_19695 [bacterium]|nr:hypothetical protein [bacterium]MCP5070042.1 hypothetical protein [bacterium]
MRSSHVWAAIALLALVVGSAGCSGCNGRPTGLYTIDPDPKEGVPPQYVERLLAQDPAAAAAFFFVNHRHGFLPSGQIEVSVNLESRIVNDEYWLEWKAVFYDADRFPVEETEWHPFRVGPSVVHTIEASSTSPVAKDYTLFVRSLR